MGQKRKQLWNISRYSFVLISYFQNKNISNEKTKNPKKTSQYQVCNNKSNTTTTHKNSYFNTKICFFLYLSSPFFFIEREFVFLILKRTRINYFNLRLCSCSFLLIFVSFYFITHFLFYRQLDFSSQPEVANGFCKKEAECCLVVAYICS